ncbi:A/G-specific adenine glycosylase [Emticicia sp. CRIBPO]|uniref:A/G-specific adenine glycosylase n=1 Tax=Emticicia sp. CRIBPO TaxID=2683258 RepID=UPI001412846E|nr:A/G-specific adenine glycosylase [Emticicia sp. CRIBPO]NBA85898.1 A/G-specific adenine glycosylase [Emticicia sp. CRIBPO]
MLAKKIADWYLKNKRDLPWRKTKDPYLIWMSEIILQQTRVSQGLPYYEKFVSAFPTVADLAQADESQVLRLWQGLGYYSRARNMHAAAKMVMKEFGGKFPDHYEDLKKLKGVGSYTAAAIASIAFGEAVPVVDGNVYRVLSRLFEIDLPITSSGAYKYFYNIADQLITGQNPADFNQAFMELGAMVCHPKNPDCEACPVHVECGAFLHKTQSEYPKKDKKVKTKERFLNYLVFKNRDHIWVNQRPSKDIWANMFDFYLVEKEDNSFDLEHELGLIFPSGLPKFVAINKSEKFFHVLTHRKITAYFWEIELENMVILDKTGEFIELSAFENLPKPQLIVNYLKQYLSHN